jgi:hypothetical protein
VNNNSVQGTYGPANNDFDPLLQESTLKIFVFLARPKPSGLTAPSKKIDDFFCGVVS